MKTKTAKYFSAPLMKQTVRSNRTLTIAIMLVMILMCVVISVARNMMLTESTAAVTDDMLTSFYSYLSAMVANNLANGTSLSYDDFIAGNNAELYASLFEGTYQSLLTSAAGTDTVVYTMDECLELFSQAGASVSNYITQYEYTYALAQSTGVLTGNTLSMQEIMTVIFSNSGISSDLLENMSDMDMSSMLNQMYYTIMGLLPLLVYIVVVGNSLIANQVDRGSMAYVLSTPTKRSAVAITQAIYMIAVPFIMIAVTCCVKIAMSAALTGDADAAVTVTLYVGMYILIEAMAALCYLGSCLFNRSGKSMAFGGGLTVWFFLASLLGLFGSDNLVQMGMGVEILGVFNNLTLIGLFDIESIGTIGSGAVDLAFVWKLVILFVIAVAAYVGGAVRFTKKDLPL